MWTWVWASSGNWWWTGKPGVLQSMGSKRVGHNRVNWTEMNETTDWFQIRKGVCQGCILSPCLFNLCTEYIIQNARLDEAQAGIKIAGKNIDNFRYADDTTLMTESEELKSLLMKVKQESKKAGLKLNIQKTRIMASGAITSWQKWGNNGNSGWLYFSGLQNHCRWWLQPWN